jgi:hypothetical protein
MTPEQFQYVKQRIDFLESRIVHIDAMLGAMRYFVIRSSLAEKPSNSYDELSAAFEVTKKSILNAYAEWNVSAEPPEKGSP